MLGGDDRFALRKQLVADVVLEYIAYVSDGLTTNTPNGGQVTISGGFALLLLQLWVTLASSARSRSLRPVRILFMPSDSASSKPPKKKRPPVAKPKPPKKKKPRPPKKKKPRKPGKPH